jgi:hypothetical protein
MNMKKTVKKMSAILAGATMVGATVMGAMAYDLSDYPSPFIQDGFFTGKIVVGEKAAPADIMGATDIAAAIQADSKTPVSTGGSVEVAGGKTEEVALGGNLNTSGFLSLDNNDVSSLNEGTLTIDIDGESNDYDFHEEIGFTSGATIDTGLTATNKDEDFKDGVYLLLQKGSIKYNYVFDDNLQAGNYINDSTDDEPITIEFLGKELEIIGATATTMTVQVGETLYVENGQKVTVAGKEVTLVRVGDDSAIVSVGGVQQTITVGNTKTVGGLRVKVKDTFNDEGVTNDAATLIVGAESTKTYADGDEFIGQDEDDPIWVWDLAGLTGATPTIGILYDQTVDDITDDPITIGQSLSLPNDFAKVELVSLNQNDYKKYTIGTSTGETLYSAAGVEEHSSAKVITFTAAGGDQDAFTVGGQDTDAIALYYNVSGTQLQVYYKDHDDANKFKLASSGNLSANVDINNLFTIQYKDSNDITVDWDATTATSGNLTIDLSAGTDVKVSAELSNNAFEYLGASDGDTETGGDVSYGAKDISGWEENTMTDKGLILYAYDISASKDEFSFGVPKEYTDFNVNVAVVGGSGSVSRVSGDTGAYMINPLPVGSTVLDKDAMNLIGNTPLIVVGGPSINTVAADLMGNPTREQINTMFTPGVGKIKLYAAQNALLVAGYEAQDTLGASYVLAQYGKYDLTGSEVEVVVPSLSSLSVRTPTN